MYYSSAGLRAVGTDLLAVMDLGPACVGSIMSEQLSTCVFNTLLS